MPAPVANTAPAIVHSISASTHYVDRPVDEAFMNMCAPHITKSDKFKSHRHIQMGELGRSTRFIPEFEVFKVSDNVYRFPIDQDGAKALKKKKTKKETIWRRTNRRPNDKTLRKLLIPSYNPP